MLKIFHKLFLISGIAMMFSSCASVRNAPTPQPRTIAVTPPAVQVPQPTLVLPPPTVTPPSHTSATVLMPPTSTLPRMDLVHSVGPGETLWRISKMYDVPVDTIKKANRISDATQLEMGLKLKIPDAAPIKPVIALYPSKKWKYIVIHHSGTDEGNSLSFHNAHLKKGWDKGVGYHFVIDNGSIGKQDGQLEATPRWVKQLDGAHCKASDMNTKAIGICLVGNFNEELPTSKQMDSLVYLIETLAKYYKIPMDHITVHGKVSGAQTDCPGSRFPLNKIKSRINL